MENKTHPSFYSNCCLFNMKKKSKKIKTSNNIKHRFLHNHGQLTPIWSKNELIQAFIVLLVTCVMRKSDSAFVKKGANYCATYQCFFRYVGGKIPRYFLNLTFLLMCPICSIHVIPKTGFLVMQLTLNKL